MNNGKLWLFFWLKRLGYSQETFCGGLNCTKVNISANEASAKFHSYRLRGATAHKAVKDKVTGIRTN